MKITTSSVEYIPQGEDLVGIYQQIEKCARTCYKSEDKITDDSAKKMVDNLFKNHHTAMLEHGTVYLKISIPKKAWHKDIVDKYYHNPYSKVNNTFDDYDYHYFITTNYRVIEENSWVDDLKYQCEPTEYHKKRYTFRFTTSRGIANELVRHRVFSFAQESSRYCNYSKDKFDNQITFIEPHWVSDNREFKNSDAYDNAYELFCSACEETEGWYNTLLDEGFKPEDAREFLPLSTKTELCMTGFQSDWERLLDIRYNESTGRVHPDMKILMSKLVEVIKTNNLWKVS